MAIELASFVNGLDETKPLNTDLVAEGDNHLRLLKTVLKSTFPGRGGAEKAPILKLATFTPGLDEISALFVATGATQANLPAISGLADGTHYWFWAEDNNLVLTTLDTALINGGETLTLLQGTGACVFCIGTAWVAIGIPGAGGGGGKTVLAGANIVVEEDAVSYTVNAEGVEFSSSDNTVVIDATAYPSVDLTVVPAQLTLGALTSVNSTTGLSIPINTWTRAIFGETLTNPGDDFDQGNSVYIVPRYGVYAFSTQCTFVAGSSDIVTDLRVAITRVGHPTQIEYIEDSFSLLAYDTRTVQVSGHVRCFASDEVEVTIYSLNTAIYLNHVILSAQYMHESVI